MLKIVTTKGFAKGKKYNNQIDNSKIKNLNNNLIIDFQFNFIHVLI